MFSTSHCLLLLLLGLPARLFFSAVVCALLLVLVFLDSLDNCRNRRSDRNSSGNSSSNTMDNASTRTSSTGALEDGKNTPSSNVSSARLGGSSSRSFK